MATPEPREWGASCQLNRQTKKNNTSCDLIAHVMEATQLNMQPTYRVVDILASPLRHRVHVKLLLELHDEAK